MPSRLSFQEHGAGLGSAATVLRANAGAAGLDAPVPTCPGWSVRDLVVHQGMVHRWAAHNVNGLDAGDGEHHAAAGRAAADLLGWFDQGATALLQALADAPADLDVPFFLLDAGPARDAWARRQSHETIIHGVDAMAARLRRPPTPAEVWFGADHALDGIDELLLGFLPRPRSGLRSDRPLTIRVAPDGVVPSWLVRVGAEPPVTTLEPDGGDRPAADATFGGSPVEVYLGLWNRGDAVTADDPQTLELWHRLQRIQW